MKHIKNINQYNNQYSIIENNQNTLFTLTDVDDIYTRSQKLKKYQESNKLENFTINDINTIINSNIVKYLINDNSNIYLTKIDLKDIPLSYITNHTKDINTIITKLNTIEFCTINIVTINQCLYITKLIDEYYEVKFVTSQKYKHQSINKTFQCDEINGLIQCLNQLYNLYIN